MVLEAEITSFRKRGMAFFSYAPRNAQRFRASTTMQVLLKARSSNNLGVPYPCPVLWLGALRWTRTPLFGSLTVAHRVSVFRYQQSMNEEK
jgi:hypothetical protein